MKGKLIISVLLFLSFFSTAVLAGSISNGMEIPTTHPRLFWTPARIAQAQSWVSSSGYSGLSSGTRALDVYDLLFTCLIMGDSTACSNAISAAMSFDPGDTLKSGNDLIRRNGEGILLTYDWAYDSLTPTQRSTLISNWNSYMTDQNTVAWGNETMPANNYFSGRNRNDFTLGVATMEDNTSADTYLNYEFNTLWPALVDAADGVYTGDWINKDHSGEGYGYLTQEGGEYGRYSLNYFNLMLPSAKLLGRNLWEESTNFKAAVLQTIYSTMPQPVDRLGTIWDTFTSGDDENWYRGGSCGYQSHNGYDGHGGCGAGSQYFGDFMQAAANEWPDTNIGKYARQFIDIVNPAIGPIQRSVDPGGSTLSFSNLPLDYYSSGAQVMYTRNNWTSDATTIMWQGGVNRAGAGHGHWDAGTFQVFRKGAYLIRETAGYGEDVAGYGGVGIQDTTLSLAHNIPIIGGEGSIKVKGISRCVGPGTVTRLDTDDNFSFMATDLSDVYDYQGNHPERENLNEVSVVRELYYLRSIDAMLVVDRIEAVSPSISTAFISHCETNPAVSGATVTCNVKGQTAKYTALLPASPSISIINESANGADADNWQYRIEAENSNPGNVYSYNIYAIEFSDQGASQLSPSIVDSNQSNPLSGTFTITLDASNSITINKGMSSSGGTITAAGITKNLENGKEMMTITDAGPVWLVDGQLPDPDTIPPVISNVGANNITTATATISWTTDEQATGIVDYGKTAGYGQQQTHTSLITSHQVALSGLQPNATYHYKVTSSDSSNNSAASSDFTFTTGGAPQPDTIPPAPPTGLGVQ